MSFRFATSFRLAMLVVLTALAAPALAQTKPATRSDAPPLHAAPSFCDRYGAGFVRVEGTDTCVKSGASVTNDAYVGSGSGTVRGSAIAPALRSQ